MNFNKISSKINFKELFVDAKVVRPVYCAISGSHLYGFNSKDSDIDIRGCHCEELNNVIGLNREHEVRQFTDKVIDFESFDLKKELGLIMANNSNVLEHLASPPLYKSKHYEELKSIGEKSLSKLVAKPYFGMAQHNLFKYLRTFNESYREAPVKKYLYVLRALMAGIYALERKRIEPNLKILNKTRMFQISVVDELIERKQQGKEKDFVAGNPEAEKAINDLQKQFKTAEENSTLPPSPLTYQIANDFLIKLRMS